MTKHFYSHLIEIESVIIEMDKLDLTLEQKHHLAHLVDSSIHSKILDTVLSELKEEDKKYFLNYLKKEEHIKIWELLNEKADKIEDKIKTAIDTLKMEIKKDINRARKEKE